MTVMDFPSAPTNGQTYGQYTYDSSKGAWRVTAPASQVAVISSATAPSSPVAGALWYNTNDGATYVYYTDVDTSQWVEIRSQIATSQVGLVPIVPTSVSVSSGSASIGTSGLVTLTSGSQVTLRNCFSTSYTDYLILVTMNLTTATRISCRYAINGTPDSTTSYTTTNFSYWSSGTAVGGAPTSSPAIEYYSTAGKHSIRFQLYKPYPANQTALFEHFSIVDADGIRIGQVRHTSTSNRDGFTLFTEDGNAMSGTVQVYGYR